MAKIVTTITVEDTISELDLHLVVGHLLSIGIMPEKRCTALLLFNMFGEVDLDTVRVGHEHVDEVLAAVHREVKRVADNLPDREPHRE